MPGSAVGFIAIASPLPGEMGRVEVRAVRECAFALDPPLPTARGVIRERRSLLVRVAGDSREGWGEVAPLPGFFGPDLDLCRMWLARNPGFDWPGPCQEGMPAPVSFAVWTALEVGRSSLEGYASTARLASLTELPPANGTVKLKVGLRDPATEAEEVRRWLGGASSGFRLRLDANQALSPGGLRLWRGILADPRLEFFEDPFPPRSAGWGDREVREFAPRIAIDEPLTGWGEWQARVDGGWRGFGVIKPSRAGAVPTAVPAPERLVISAAFEGPVGWLGLWAASRRFPATVPGLDTLRWLGAAGEVCRDSRIDLGPIVAWADRLCGEVGPRIQDFPGQHQSPGPAASSVNRIECNTRSASGPDAGSAG